MSSRRSGIHSNIQFRNISKEEEKIIRLFSSLWFITFVKHQLFKESEYTFAFARPSQFLIDRYHFEREVLILFSPYERFDTRSLDFVDKVVFEYQNRLDKLLIILVSRDQTVMEKVSNVIIQDQESRIYIPFSYDEFEKQEAVELIESKIKKYFFTRDLFSFNSPLKSENYFFGRTEATNNFYDKYRTGENSGLFGLRKIGKTSSLYAIKRLLDVRKEPSIFIDCQDPSFHKRRWNEALEYVITNGTKQLNFIEKKKLNINNGYDEKNASAHFEEDLVTLYKANKSKRILLIFDEIESITFEISPSEHWTTDFDFIYFWQAIRSIFQKNPNLFSFIIAGVNPKCVETANIRGTDNPIYKMIRPNYLKFFDLVQVQEMVTTIGTYMGVEFESEVFTYLTDDYGGHPYLVRDICSFLSKLAPNERPVKISRFLYHENKAALDLRLNDYLRLILDVLKTYYPMEYELLAYLAAGDQETFKDFALEFSESVSHLLGYGIVEQENSNFHFKIKSVKEYINKTVKFEEKIAKSKRTRWSVISEKRNLLETNLRKIILAVLIPRYGNDDAKKRILNKLGKRRQEKNSNLSISEILESEKSEIYLDDLRKIILEYWDYFERLFGRDRESVDFYLNRINKFRIDAHAKEISDEDYSVVLSGFSWLEDHIKELTFI